uniref:Fucolectin tachylectin-4 pentraxin-1 domain-containing protein n=1 Tax=Salarias fasciatus TaxID=181472 RepID=A0A672HXQ5_SALFA
MMKLRVFLPLLLLGTVSCYKNVALRGTASQISQYDSMFGAASNAIDGNRAATFKGGSCTHSRETRDPWWRVDLLRPYIVTSITVTNRGDCCEHRLNGLEVRVGNATLESPKVGMIPKAGAGETITMNFTEQVEGRYVTLLLPGRAKILTLCEVEVYGYPAPTGENLALKGKASQSSLHMFSYAFNAIDGNRDTKFERGSCSQTANEISPWWRLDLRKTHKIFTVKVVNQESNPQQLDGAGIYIGDSLENGGNRNPRCAVILEMEAGELVEFNCNGMEGRYVSIVIPDREGSLVLCEVEVYGSPLD